MSIYTKNGDDGKSSLNIDSNRLDKDSLVFEVMGTLDELNAHLGYLNTTDVEDVSHIIPDIQKDLLYIGSLISQNKCKEHHGEKLKTRVVELERLIDFFESRNPPLSNFILPGGSKDSSRLHVARAVCRRAERLLVKYSKTQTFSIDCMITYVNRLSDLLFSAARYVNKSQGYNDVIWRASDI